MESYLNPELLNKEHMLDIAHSSSKIFSLSHIVVDLDEVDFRVYNSQKWYSPPGAAFGLSEYHFRLIEPNFYLIKSINECNFFM